MAKSITTPPIAHEALEQPQVGQRIKVKQPTGLERFPHFILPQGRTATVTEADNKTIFADFDEPFTVDEPDNKTLCWQNEEVPGWTALQNFWWEMEKAD